MSSPRASASQPQPSRDASVAPLPRIAGQIGAGLAAFGTAGFAAASPISIAGAEIAAGIALLGAILAIVSGRWRYRPTPVDVPLLLFFAAEILSIPFSVHPARSLRCLKGDWFLVLFFGFSQAFRHSRDVRRAFRILLVSSSIVAGYALLQMFLGQDLLRHRPLEPLGSFFIATGFFGHHLTYGGHVLLTAALAASWWAFERPRRRQVPGRVAGILLQTAGVVASFARTAWIGFAAAIATIALLARGPIRRLAIASGGIVLALLLALAPLRERLGAFVSFGDDPRVRLWQTALRIWRDHPIFGAGLGSFKTQFPIYKVPGHYMATGHPHNDLLNILVHSGIVGIAAFAFLWYRYFRAVAGAERRVPKAGGPRALLLAGILVPAAFFVGGLGQCFLTDEEVGILFWFLVAGFLAVAREVRDGVA